MIRSLRFQCGDCGRKLAAVAGMSSATQVVKRSCRCGARWQIVIKPREVITKAGAIWLDAGELVRV